MLDQVDNLVGRYTRTSRCRASGRIFRVQVVIDELELADRYHFRPVEANMADLTDFVVECCYDFASEVPAPTGRGGA